MTKPRHATIPLASFLVMQYYMALGFAVGAAIAGSIAMALGNLLLARYLWWIDRKRLHIGDEATGERYLWRFPLLRAWLRIFVHRIWRHDKDRDLHNHPWRRGWAFVLRGGYTELRREGVDGELSIEGYRQLQINRIGPETWHRIIHVEPNTWTLFIATNRARHWSFLVNGVPVDWRKYLGLPMDTELED